MNTISPDRQTSPRGNEQAMLSRLMIRMIRWYQRNLSPHLGSCCKYLPTCSEYAIEAIEKHGPLLGGLMAAWRILRCNPFSRGGYDPVR